MQHARAKHALDPNESLKVIVFVAVLAYVISVVIRIALSCFSKTIDVMPDELRYLDIARSLLIDGTLTIRGDESDFQKILYPLIIGPALLTSDTHLQITLISIINSIVACSAIFPAAIIARKLFHEVRWVIACILATAVYPDLCYSMTFMSETLYFPLALWIILVLWNLLADNVTHPKTIAFLAGILCFAGYLCKEVALCFLIAFVILSLLRVRDHDANYKVLAIIQTGLFLASFIFLFVLSKLILFTNLGNSYDQMSIWALLDPYAALYAIYATGINATYLLLATCFFPVVFTAVFINRIPHTNKQLAKLLLISLIICFFTIIYTISIREDIGNTIVRQHMRYYSAMLLPLMFLFLSMFTAEKAPTFRESVYHGIPLAVTTGCFCLAMCTLFGNSDYSQGFDGTLLHMYRMLEGIDGSLVPIILSPDILQGSEVAQSASPEFVIDWVQWLISAIAIIIVLTLAPILLGKNHRIAAIAFFAITIMLYIANTIACSLYNYDTYVMDKEDVAAVCEVNEYLRDNADGNVLIIIDDEYTDANNLTDTYIEDYNRKYIYVTNVDIEESLEDNGVLNLRALLTKAGHADAYDEGIKYAVTNDEQFLDFIQKGSKRIELESDLRFKLYEFTPKAEIKVATNSAS